MLKSGLMFGETNRGVFDPRFRRFPIPRAHAFTLLEKVVPKPGTILPTNWNPDDPMIVSAIPTRLYSSRQRITVKNLRTNEVSHDRDPDSFMPSKT